MNEEEIDLNSILDVTEIQQFTNKFISCIVTLKDGQKIKCVGKKNLFNEDQKIRKLIQTPLRKIMPKIYGVKNIEGIDYILMENLSTDFTSPCHLDMKLGFRTWDINVSQKMAQRSRERCLFSTSRVIAFRLDRGEYFRNGKCLMNLQKGYLIKLSTDWVGYTLNSFMPINIYEQFHQTINQFIQVYKEMLNLYPNFRVYSSSVLLYYDSDHLDYPPRIRYIDFAHSHLDIVKDGGDLSEEFNDHVLDGLILGEGMTILPDDSPKEIYKFRIEQNSINGIDVTKTYNNGQKTTRNYNRK